jgi:hypothetical protein
MAVFHFAAHFRIRADHDVRPIGIRERRGAVALRVHTVESLQPARHGYCRGGRVGPDRVHLLRQCAAQLRRFPGGGRSHRRRQPVANPLFGGAADVAATDYLQRGAHLHDGHRDSQRPPHRRATRRYHRVLDLLVQERDPVHQPGLRHSRRSVSGNPPGDHRARPHSGQTAQRRETLRLCQGQGDATTAA